MSVSNLLIVITKIASAFAAAILIEWIITRALKTPVESDPNPKTRRRTVYGGVLLVSAGMILGAAVLLNREGPGYVSYIPLFPNEFRQISHQISSTKEAERSSESAAEQADEVTVEHPSDSGTGPANPDAVPGEAGFVIESSDQQGDEFETSSAEKNSAFPEDFQKKQTETDIQNKDAIWIESDSPQTSAQKSD